MICECGSTTRLFGRHGTIDVRLCPTCGEVFDIDNCMVYDTNLLSADEKRRPLDFSTDPTPVSVLYPECNQEVTLTTMPTNNVGL